MLFEDTLIYYFSNIEECRSYADTVAAPHKWYSNFDKGQNSYELVVHATVRRAKQLPECIISWGTPRLCSQTHVLSEKTQCKLLWWQRPKRWAHDRRRHQVHTRALQDRIPRIVQQITNRIVTGLSGLSRTASSSVVQYSPFLDLSFSNQTMHTLKQSYGGAVRQSVNHIGAEHQ